MGLYGPPPPQLQKRQSAGTGTKRFGATGGAGNNSWYTPEVAAAASATQRPSPKRSSSSASFSPLNRTAHASAAAQQYQYAPAPTSTAARTVAAPAATLAAQPQPAATQPLSATSTAGPSAAVDHAEDCICTICTCGKHACPPTPRSTHYPTTLSSEARSSYSGRFEPAVRAQRPDTWKPRNVPFEGESTTRTDFKDYGIVPRSQARRTAADLMDTGVGRSHVPFDDTTTHKSDFPAHPLGTRQPAKPLQANLSTLGPDDRDFATEGRTCYVPHALQSRQARPPEQARPSLPFVGTTTNKSDFAPHPNARPSQPTMRHHGFESGPDDRDFTTENRKNFTRPPASPPCPAITVATASKPHSGHVKVEPAPGNTFRRTEGW